MLVVRVDRGHPPAVHVHEHGRLAAALERVEDLRLEVADAQEGVQLMPAGLLHDRLARARDDEGQREPFAPADLLGAVQHGGEEWAGGERVVLAVQQEADATDPVLAQLREVVAQAQGGVADDLARLFRQAGLVAQAARHGADGQAGGLGDIADGDAAHGVAAILEGPFSGVNEVAQVSQVFRDLR